MSTQNELAMIGTICIIFGVVLIAKYNRRPKKPKHPEPQYPTTTIDFINCGIGMACSAGAAFLILAIIANLP